MGSYPEAQELNAIDRLDRASQWLGRLGIKEFHPAELKSFLRTTNKAICIGMVRKGEPTEADGGCLAFNSLIEPLPEDALKFIQPGSQVVVGNFGGTRWQAGLAEFDGSQVNPNISQERVFPQDKRQFKSPKLFAQEMVKQLSEAAGEQKPSVVALSFGFQQNPEWTDYGLDAAVPLDEPAKYWVVKGLAGKKIGALIIEEAKKQGWQIEKIYITNDTNATALDHPGARYGFVGGSGTNACLAIPSYKGGCLQNLEAGRLRSFPETDIIRLMRRLQLLPGEDNIAEFYTGGDFLIKQLASVGELFKLIMETNYGPALLEQGSEIVSLWARGDKEVIENQLGQRISETDFAILEKTSKRILTKAGQTMGIMMASIVAIAGGPKPVIPAEGSVLWQAEGAMKATQETLETLLPDNCPQIIEASGTRGIAIYALYQSSLAGKS